MLVIDDTALPKKGKHSVGVASQFASALGKNANCQTLVSLTTVEMKLSPISCKLSIWILTVGRPPAQRLIAWHLLEEAQEITGRWN